MQELGLQIVLFFNLEFDDSYDRLPLPRSRAEVDKWIEFSPIRTWIDLWNPTNSEGKESWSDCHGNKTKFSYVRAFKNSCLTPTGQNGTDRPKSYFFRENPILRYENLVQSNFYPPWTRGTGFRSTRQSFLFFERSTLSERFWRFKIERSVKKR